MKDFGHFDRIPRCDFLEDGRLVMVCRSFTFIRADGESITVPENFVCDGASIPKIAWPISGGPFEGKHRDGALVHDFLYASRRTDTREITRGEADRIFYEAMRARGVNEFHARAKYIAVHGWQQIRHGHAFPYEVRWPPAKLEP